MPLPNGSIILHGESLRPKPAFLIRFPEDAWASLEEAARTGGRVEISVDGSMSLILPDSEPLPLEARTIGNSTEIHHFSPSSSSLTPIGVASTRLDVPLSSTVTARAADKLRQQNEQHDKERKERADRVNGAADHVAGRSKTGPSVKYGSHLSAGTAMGRTQSTPSMSASTSITVAAPASASTAAAPIIPLKTRVMQLLALGPTTVNDIVKRVGGVEQDVMRVVKVVGKCINNSPPTYTLDPNQYSKIKIGNWKYTYAEKRRVIFLARTAFDELGLEPEAEERIELDRKEAEALSNNTGAGSSSDSSASEGAPPPITPAPATSSLPVTVQIQGNGTDHSPRKPVLTGSAPGSAKKSDREKESKEKGAPKEKKEKTAPQTKFGKQIARFRAESAKRATSLPNTKNESGTATPVRGSTPVMESTPVPTPERSKIEKEKKVEEKGKKRKRDEILKSRRSSRDYTSSEGESDGEKPIKAAKKSNQKDEERGRARDVKTARPRDSTPADTMPSFKKDKKADATSIDSVVSKTADRSPEGARGGNHISPTPPGRTFNKHTTPTPSSTSTMPTNGNGHHLTKPNGIINGQLPHGLPAKPTTSLHDSLPRRDHTPSPMNGTRMERVASHDHQKATTKDPEEMRERYEELVPAYELLTKKLMDIHRACEDVHSGPGDDTDTDDKLKLSKDELNKLVTRWEKWHKELDGIRRWFGEAGGSGGASVR